MSRSSEWKALTDARVLTASGLRREIRKERARVIGVVGFSGSFEKNPRLDAQAACRAALTTMFRLERERAADAQLWCMSGATNIGVPGIAYEVAGSLGLVCVGVTARAARAYPIAPVEFLVVVGKHFGDESETMISLSTELWVIGGGSQSKNEVALAADAGIPITVFRGLGGIADELEEENLSARFVEI